MPSIFIYIIMHDKLSSMYSTFLSGAFEEDRKKHALNIKSDFIFAAI
jgi:hypothetical protein